MAFNLFYSEILMNVILSCKSPLVVLCPIFLLYCVCKYLQCSLIFSIFSKHACSAAKTLNCVWPVLKILVPKFKLKICKTWYTIYSFLSLGSKNSLKKNENEVKKSKNSSLSFGTEIPKTGHSDIAEQ